MEVELEKAEERCEMAESKSTELEEELKILANNLRTGDFKLLRLEEKNEDQKMSWKILVEMMYSLRYYN